MVSYNERVIDDRVKAAATYNSYLLLPTYGDGLQHWDRVAPKVGTVVIRIVLWVVQALAGEYGLDDGAFAVPGVSGDAGSAGDDA